MTQVKDLEQTAAEVANTLMTQGGQKTHLYHTLLQPVEIGLIRSVMSHADNNQTVAAEMMGISRTTLRKKISCYGLTFEIQAQQ